MCRQGSETRSQLSWRESFPSGDRGEMRAGVGDEHGRVWKVWEVRLEMGVSGNLWIVVKDVKTLVVYDVE